MLSPYNEKASPVLGNERELRQSVSLGMAMMLFIIRGEIKHYCTNNSYNQYHR
ncbi:hypothetical protein SPONL_1822 [uncultured Candidatus Thioglobus sp.]|nr:hypothetical protein SPONL_1822 [uncultured Candidatus Thioglobus sp.]